jgi:uncharacterized repeat protein (TIGR04076 family)
MVHRCGEDTVSGMSGDRAGARDEFTLWDLRVEVVEGDRPMVCNHRPGDFFEVSGENLTLPPGQSFPIYPLAAILPLLPAKQRGPWIWRHVCIGTFPEAFSRCL